MGTNTQNAVRPNPPIIPHVSLCTGYDGIGLGLARVVPNLVTIGYCEREVFAVSNLIAKIEAGLLDAAPVFPCVSAFPWLDYAPVMAGGILSFGWPCQPVSCAGKRKATEDERWLFDIIADGIVHMRPGIIFAENVEGLLSAKMPDGSSVFGHCISRLEALHYKIAAGIFSASEVGAPHQRKRVFILGVADYLGERGQELCRQIAAWAELGPVGDDGGDAGGLAVAGRVQSELPAGIGPASGHSQEGGASGQFAGPDGCAWPSRPGEPQYGWEPPRVVGNAESGNSGIDANGKREPVEGRQDSGSTGEGVGNASGRGCGERGDAARPERGGHADGADEAVGDSAQRQDNGGEPRDLGEAAGQRGCGDDAARRAGGRGELADAGLPERVRWSSDGNQQPRQRPPEGAGGSSSAILADASGGHGGELARPDVGPVSARDGQEHGDDERETFTTLGRDFDGNAARLGLSECASLSDQELAEIHRWMVAHDNRTDELRLLGNGVVPACAELAFRTLLDELTL